MQADLTVSVINHSNPRLLQGCLRSLFAATHTVTLEVWVVDNATQGELVPELQAEFPSVRWLVNTERRGFSANHNQVLERSQSRYACILNDDILVHDGAFDTLVAYMDAHPKVGMAGAKLLNTDGTLQNCTFRFMTLWSELVSLCFLPGPLNTLKTARVDPAQAQDVPASVDWVLGACIVVRAAALAQIGLLDAVLSPVGNGEEVDWCFRAHRAGWDVCYCPSAVLTHYGGQSFRRAGAGPDKTQIETRRVTIRLARKHFGAANVLLIRAMFIFTLPWNLLMLTQTLLRRRTSRGEYLGRVKTALAVAHLGVSKV